MSSVLDTSKPEECLGEPPSQCLHQARIHMASSSWLSCCTVQCHKIDLVNHGLHNPVEMVPDPTYRKEI